MDKTKFDFDENDGNYFGSCSHLKGQDGVLVHQQVEAGVNNEDREPFTWK
ncbi:hypothetical protein [Salinimicrobium sp. GXAS 041]